MGWCISFHFDRLFALNPLAATNNDVLSRDILLTIFLSAIAWYVAPLIFGHQGFGDSDKYIAIARDPFVFTESPWGYRLLVPWLVAGMSATFGITLENGFQLVQAASYTLCLAIIVFVAKNLNAEKWVKVLGPLVFTFGYQYIYYRHNFIHVGLMELLVLAALIWLTHVKKWRSILLLLTISIFIKESIAFIFLQTLVVYWLIEKYVFGNSFTKSYQIVLICVMPIIVFLLIRINFGLSDSSATASYLSGYDRNFFSKVFNGNFVGRIVEYFTVFGVLVYLIPISVRFIFNSSFIRINLLIQVFSVSQLLLAIDSKRMACMGVISLIFILTELSKCRRERSRLFLLTIFQLIYAYGWLTQNYWLSIVAMVMGGILLILPRIADVLMARTDILNDM